MRRGLLLACFLACFLAVAGTPAAAEDPPADGTTVTAGNGVVVHGVDTKLLVARLRDVDRRMLEGDAKGAASGLAEILAGDLDPLIEDGENAYLCMREAAYQRVLTLAPEGLAAYRAIVDPRARAALAAGASASDASILADAAERMVLATDGPRLCVALADLRASRGDARLAAQTLSDLLRLWAAPGAMEDLPGVERAEVVARLGGLFATLGDEAGVRWLVRESPAKLLDGSGAGWKAQSLRDELAFCATAAAAAGRGPSALPAGPSRPLRVAAQIAFTRETGGLDVTRSRELPERPLAIGTPSSPGLLTREPFGTTPRPRLVALAPAEGGTLVARWMWPAREELTAATRRGGHGPFSPGRCGDTVLFAWPAVATHLPPGGEQFGIDEHWTLVALSLAAEGRLVDERGSDEEGRDDADPALLEMSFTGRPLVVGNAVFTTMVRRSDNGDMTELHVARFDLSEGPAARLRLRWRRHVVDGRAMPAVILAANLETNETRDDLAAPASMAERCGRIYLASNTGAVACLDGANGLPLWVHAYPRFGPPLRNAIVETEQRTWGDVPVALDGPFVWAAPRDAECLFQFREMPRSARTTLIQSWRFHGGAATSTDHGPPLANVRPDALIAVTTGVGYFAGSVPGHRIAGLTPPGSPLAALRMREAEAGEALRPSLYAQIPEAASSGSACLVRGAILLPTYKAIYRVELSSFESAPQSLFQRSPATKGQPPDEIGNLVADGDRLWSVTGKRVVLFEPK